MIDREVGWAVDWAVVRRQTWRICGNCLGRRHQFHLLDLRENKIGEKPYRVREGTDETTGPGKVILRISA